MNTQHKLIVAMSLCAAAVPNLTSAASISGQGTWESTLQGRDLDGVLTTAEAYYDTSLDITWLADASYTKNSGYLASDTMDWSTAAIWARDMNPYNSSITGWRLPMTTDVGDDGCATSGNVYQGVDCNFNIMTHSEMSHMFYVTLGNKAYFDTSGNGPQPGYGLSNTGPFSNILPGHYWSALTYTPTNFAPEAWIFGFNDGDQGTRPRLYSSMAWAVHAGDVGTPTVPVPPAAWLFGSGLLGLIGIARKKAA